jgi:hypothetical protein
VNRAELEYLPLSFSQERLWFIAQLDTNNTSYNVPLAAKIHGDLDIDHVDQAMNLIIARHENLRTIFPGVEGQARQVVLDELDFKVERIDLSDCGNAPARDERARKLCLSEAATPFDLASGPLIRGKVIRLSPQEHIVMLNMHHIISDGWSMGVLLREISDIVDALRQGKPAGLAALPIQYLDYSVWQRNWLEQGGVLKQQLGYWKEKLAGVPESLNLATDYPRPAVQSFAGATYRFAVEAELTRHECSLRRHRVGGDPEGGGAVGRQDDGRCRGGARSHGDRAGVEANLIHERLVRFELHAVFDYERVGDR